MEILLLVICATLSGADGWEAIEEFGNDKLLWFQRFFPVTHGVPSHDWIAAVISMLNPKRFQEAFIRRTQALAEATKGDAIAVDGVSTGEWKISCISVWMWSFAKMPAASAAATPPRFLPLFVICA